MKVYPKLISIIYRNMFDEFPLGGEDLDEWLNMARDEALDWMLWPCDHKGTTFTDLYGSGFWCANCHATFEEITPCGG